MRRRRERPPGRGKGVGCMGRVRLDPKVASRNESGPQEQWLLTERSGVEELWGGGSSDRTQKVSFLGVRILSRPPSPNSPTRTLTRPKSRSRRKGPTFTSTFRSLLCCRVSGVASLPSFLSGVRPTFRLLRCPSLGEVLRGALLRGPVTVCPSPENTGQILPRDPTLSRGFWWSSLCKLRPLYI